MDQAAVFKGLIITHAGLFVTAAALLHLQVSCSYVCEAENDYFSEQSCFFKLFSEVSGTVLHFYQ